MKTNSLSRGKIPTNVSARAMKQHHRIHRDDLMARDLVSEILLTGGSLVIVMTLLFVLWQIMGTS